MPRWMRFWFNPADPRDLGIARFLYVAMMVLVCFPPSARKWPVTPWSAALWPEVTETYWQPIGIFKWLGLEVLPPAGMFALWTIFYVALLFACIGLFTRPSLIIVFVLDLYLTNLRSNFGKVDWSWLLPPIIFLFLAASRCGDSFSVDAWRRKGKPLPPSGEYLWPLQAIRVWMSMAYVASGVSKLRNSGMEWMTSDTLGVYLVRANYKRVFAANNPITHWGLQLAQHHWMLVGFTVFTMIVELGYPLALFSVRARWFMVVSAVGMHIGIAFLIGAFFLPWICAAVFWVPWGRLIDEVQKLRAARTQP